MNFRNYFPFVSWGKLITKKTIIDDLIAGLLGAIIVLPQGVAFAAIAGLPPEYGLYSAIVPAIIAALFGSSWHLVSGPTTAISLVVFATISPLAPVGSPEYIQMVLTMTFIVGIIQLIMGWMKFGKSLDFISHTVVVGFTAGAAILIASSQIKNFFGMSIKQGSSFYETLHYFLSHLNEINLFVLAVGLTTLIMALLLKKFFPKIPYMIPAMIIGSVLGYYLNNHYGFALTNIKTVGSLPSILPPISSPSFILSMVKQVASPALAVTMLALTEAVAISKAIALRSGQKIDGNQEVIGQGMSNIIGSFFSAYPASGSFNRSGLNFESGAKTPLASIIAAIFLSIIILFVGPLAAFLPTAVMAAILFLVAWGLIDFYYVKNIFRISRAESTLLAVTFISTLFIELEFAIFVGVFLSIAIYLRNSAKPVVTCCVPSTNSNRRKFVPCNNLPLCPQLSILRFEGSIFFGSVNYIEQIYRRFECEKNSPSKILLVLSGVGLIDLSGIEFLENIIKQKRSKNGDIYISNINKRVFDVMKNSDFLKIIGNDHIFDSKPDAISAIVPLLKKEICSECKAKIFQECDSVTQ